MGHLDGKGFMFLRCVYVMKLSATIDYCINVGESIAKAVQISVKRVKYLDIYGNSVTISTQVKLSSYSLQRSSIQQEWNDLVDKSKILQGSGAVKISLVFEIVGLFCLYFLLHNILLI